MTPTTTSTAMSEFIRSRPKFCLDLTAGRSIALKLRSALTKDITPEEGLWLGVITYALRELSGQSGKARREAWDFLSGKSGDIERVCENSGLQVDYLHRTIMQVVNHVHSEETQAA